VGEVRVVFPSWDLVDSVLGLQLVEDVAQSRSLPGLPADILSGRLLTISLAANPRPGIDGLASAGQSMVILPFEAVAASWTRDQRRRVLRHELAHVGLGRYLSGIQLPSWFREGFAEWAAGGLDCEASGRIHVFLALGGDLEDAATPSASRVWYDLSASFVAYLDRRGQVADGALIASVRRLGMDGGMRATFGAGEDVLRSEWWTRLLDQPSSSPPRECGSAWESRDRSLGGEAISRRAPRTLVPIGSGRQRQQLGPARPAPRLT
jgi:hypothetical protein